jgi:hypothetical protein
VEIAHGAVTRRPPISLDTIVARTKSYAYEGGVWDLSIVQGPFSVVQKTPKVTIRNFCIRCIPAPGERDSEWYCIVRRLEVTHDSTRGAAAWLMASRVQSGAVESPAPTLREASPHSPRGGRCAGVADGQDDADE